MNKLRELHKQAMELADEAFIARRQGDKETAQQLFANAYQLEAQSAKLADREPSRSILSRSAATLALQASLFQEAEHMVSFGLAGEPPLEIADELREVRELYYQHAKRILSEAEQRLKELLDDTMQLHEILDKRNQESLVSPTETLQAEGQLTETLGDLAQLNEILGKRGKLSYS